MSNDLLNDFKGRLQEALGIQIRGWLSADELIEKVTALTADKEAASTWIPKCKNCGRAITRVDMPPPEGPTMQGQHGWMHVAPVGVFCPPYRTERGEEFLQNVACPEDSIICRAWENLDDQRKQAEAHATTLAAELQKLKEAK